MHETGVQQLESWREFYLLTGTAGVTLTGLLFVVVSLGPGIVASEKATGVRAFVSPNIVMFTTTLVVSMFLLIPGLSATAIGTFLCLGAVASLGYLAYTRAHRQWRHNKLSYPDWVWYVGLPPIAYVLLLLSGIGFLLQSTESMHGVAASLILLLVIGIRNAWDLVIWMIQQEHKQAMSAGKEK